MYCKSCSINLTSSQKVYCSNKCQKDFEYNNYILAWKAGEKSGVRGLSTKNFSRHLVRYLLEKNDCRCSKCGWAEINPITKQCPLEIDHIDGNAENNLEENLQLLCPNCHSLTPNYKNLNFGSGRLWRRKKYVKIVRAPL